MKEDLNTTSLCFDDILLVPRHSSVETRENISIRTKFGNPNNPEAWLDLDMPIMTAPMEFINSNPMIEKVIGHGGMAFIHRQQDETKRFDQFKALPEDIKKSNRVGFVINLKEAEDINFVNNILSCGIKVLLVDTAFAHLQKVVDSIKKLRSQIPNNVHIMSGNVSSYEAYKNLMDAGADSVRVGIGAGAACTTRVVTGFGVPVLGSVMDIYKNVQSDIINGIVLDGGIKESGDIVKALAAGSSAVMMGNMFAGYSECDKQEDGQILFRGLASESIKLTQIDYTLEDTNVHHIEGVSAYIADKGPVKKQLLAISDSLKSALSYCGSENIENFKKDCIFIKVSSESIKESKSRI
jgi:IMP dehydrogenase/GMP reductase